MKFLRMQVQNSGYNRQPTHQGFKHAPLTPRFVQSSAPKGGWRRTTALH